MTTAVKLTPAQQTALNTIAKHGGIERNGRGDYAFRDGDAVTFEDVPKTVTIKAMFSKNLITSSSRGLATGWWTKFGLTDAGKALVR